MCYIDPSERRKPLTKEEIHKWVQEQLAMIREAYEEAKKSSLHFGARR